MSRHALLIGINYIGTSGELKGCIQDVQHIKYFLETFCGYPAQNITVLTEKSDLKPTKANIESAITRFSSNKKAGDTLVFHYSGHGTRITDTNGDEADKMDEVIVPLDYNRAGVITDDWLYTNMCCKIPKDATLYGFLDCCHSGTGFDLKYNWLSNCSYKNSGKATKYIPAEWTDKFGFWMERRQDVVGNVLLLSGCEPAQTSADAYIENKSQGAFSYCLIETLKMNIVKIDNKQVFKNGTMKLRDIVKEINARLDISGFEQNSQLSCGKLSDFERPFTL